MIIFLVEICVRVEDVDGDGVLGEVGGLGVEVLVLVVVVMKDVRVFVVTLRN